MEHGNVQPKGLTQEKFLVVNTSGELEETLYGESDLTAVIVATSGADALYVNVAGDTMTGQLEVNADFGHTANADGLVKIINTGNDGVGQNLGLYIETTGDSSGLRIIGNGNVSQPQFGLSHNALAVSEATGKCFSFSVAGNSFARGVFYSDGSYGIGDGSSTRDVYIFRDVPGVMGIAGNAWTKSPAALKIYGDLEITDEADIDGQLRANFGLVVSGSFAQFSNGARSFSNIGGNSNNTTALRTAGEITGIGGSGITNSSLFNNPGFQNLTGDVTYDPVSYAGNRVQFSTTSNFVTPGIDVKGVADFYSDTDLSNAIGGGDLTIENSYGFYRKTQPTPAAGVTVENAYGIYLEDVNVGTNENYAIYTNAGKVRFGDTVQSVGIPSTTQNISAGYTVQDTDYGTVLYVEGNGVITLPLTPTTDAHLWIKNLNTFAVTINGNGNNIEKNVTDTIPFESSIHLHFDGTAWWVI